MTFDNVVFLLTAARYMKLRWIRRTNSGPMAPECWWKCDGRLLPPTNDGTQTTGMYRGIENGFYVFLFFNIVVFRASCLYVREIEQCWKGGGDEKRWTRQRLNSPDLGWRQPLTQPLLLVAGIEPRFPACQAYVLPAYHASWHFSVFLKCWWSLRGVNSLWCNGNTSFLPWVEEDSGFKSQRGSVPKSSKQHR